MTASKSCGSIEVVGSVRLRVIDGLTGLGWAFHFLGYGSSCDGLVLATLRLWRHRTWGHPRDSLQAH